MSKMSPDQRLALFALGADKLAAALQGLSEEQLDLCCAPGEWTIRQIVHHVADDGDAFALPLKKAIATPGAPIRFEGFPGNEPWADALAFDKRPIGPALALIAAHRQTIVQLLEYLPDAWERCVTILDSQGQEMQEISGGSIVGMLAEHMDEHIGTIGRIREKHSL